MHRRTPPILKRPLRRGAARPPRPISRTSPPAPRRFALRRTEAIRRRRLGGSCAARLAIGLAAIASAAGRTAANEAPGRPPNAVVFLADDLGRQDASVPFHATTTELNRRFRTPALERLAARGVKFTQAYACCVCSPSRVSLMTGRNAARHRVTSWTFRRGASHDRPHPTLAMPEWNVNGLSPEPGTERTAVATPLPALLRCAGYRTIHVGKARFGAQGAPGSDPLRLGFDVHVGGHAAGSPGSYLGRNAFRGAARGADADWDVPGLEAYHGRDVFLTEALTREALRAVDRAVADDKPFLLHLAHDAVHLPLEEDRRFVRAYREAGLDPAEATYAALVEGLDRSLGDVVAQRERLGVSDRTVLLFVSDNGGLSAHGRGGPPHVRNRPLSSGKGSLREGGIRVPMLAVWPGRTPTASTCTTPVMIEDFFPTVRELAGVSHASPDATPPDGLSFVPLLHGLPDPRRDQRPLTWHDRHAWGPVGPGIGPASALRLGDWKLIDDHAGQRYELFDLAADLGETRNRADELPELRTRLARAWGARLAVVGEQMPTDKATVAPVPYPGAP